MSKRKVTFYRHVTGVEEIKMMVDTDIDDPNTMTEEEAHEIVNQAVQDGTSFVDLELLEVEYPHAMDVDGDYVDFSAYMKENG